MLYQDVSVFFLFCIYNSVLCKAKFDNKPSTDADITSWSYSASHMIFSRWLGESRYPWWTPTVVLNQLLVMPLNRTALLALTCRFSMTSMVLAYMLYFLIVAHKASCHTLCQRRSWRDSVDDAGISRRESGDWIFVLWYSFSLLTIEPANKIMVLITWATSEGSGEPVHPHSLTRAFAVRTHEVWK